MPYVFYLFFFLDYVGTTFCSWPGVITMTTAVAASFSNGHGLCTDLFAEKSVLKLVVQFSDHCCSIES